MQVNSFLENPLFRGLSILILAILVLWSIQKCYRDTGTDIDPPNPSASYLALKKDIENYKSQKWNQASYPSINANISQYSDSALISLEEKVALKSYLDAVGLHIIGDTIRSFCLNRLYTKKTKRPLGELEKGLVPLMGEEVIALKTLIEDYKSVFNCGYSGINYAKTRKYSYKDSLYYRTLWRKSMSSSPELKRNKSLSQLKKDMTKFMGRQSFYNELLQSADSTSISNWVCSQEFKDNTYYKIACDSLKK